MAEIAEILANYAWLKAYCDKTGLQARRREKNHFKDLLWHSSNSWLDKERAVAWNTVRAAEESYEDFEHMDDDEEESVTSLEEEQKQKLEE